jgi:hypothetical protein
LVQEGRAASPFSPCAVTSTCNVQRMKGRSFTLQSSFRNARPPTTRIVTGQSINQSNTCKSSKVEGNSRARTGRIQQWFRGFSQEGLDYLLLQEGIL